MGDWTTLGTPLTSLQISSIERNIANNMVIEVKETAAVENDYGEVPSCGTELVGEKESGHCLLAVEELDADLSGTESITEDAGAEDANREATSSQSEKEEGVSGPGPGLQAATESYAGQNGTESATGTGPKNAKGSESGSETGSGSGSGP